MHLRFTIVLPVLLLLFSVDVALGQLPTPTPDIPITVASVKVRKMRSFPAEVEIQTSLGEFRGTGSLKNGPIPCTSVAPCLSGTIINTQFYLESVTGTISGENFAMSQGFWISVPGWEIPYFHPYGRQIRKVLSSFIYPTTVRFNRVSTPMINYAAPVNMTGMQKAEMAPLKRFQSPRPYSEFISVEIELAQTPPS